MNWQNIWFDPETHRLRSGWRVILFLSLTSILTIMLAYMVMVMVLPFLPRSSQGFIYAATIIFDATAIVVFISVGIWALRVFDHLPAQTLRVTPARPLGADGGDRL